MPADYRRVSLVAIEPGALIAEIANGRDRAARQTDSLQCPFSRSCGIMAQTHQEPAGLSAALVPTLMRMGQTNLRASLRKRYSALAGELDDTKLQIERINREFGKLPELEAKIPELEKLISAAEILLRDNDPDWSPDDTPSIKPWTHHIPVPFGQCGRRGLKVLRETDQPMSVRQVAREVLRQCDVTQPEPETLRRVQNSIESSFRKFRGRTVESSGKYPAQWRAINKPEITFDP